MDPPVTRQTVLVVEDETHIRELICLHRQLEQLDCVQAVDSQTALDMARARRFDLSVLDVMLPGLDGITVCRASRRESVNTDVPILMLTARREEPDKVVGLAQRPWRGLRNRASGRPRRLTSRVASR